MSMLQKFLLTIGECQNAGNANTSLLYDVASGSEITPYNKIDKPLVVYRFLGNVMTSITMLHIMTKL